MLDNHSTANIFKIIVMKLLFIHFEFLLFQLSGNNTVQRIVIYRVQIID